jgi:nitric-oxide synthase
MMTPLVHESPALPRVIPVGSEGTTLATQVTERQVPQPGPPEPFAAPPGHEHKLLSEADAFLHLFHQESGRQGEYLVRHFEVRSSIARCGTYAHTPEELEYGARVAWRNNARCIGRLYWTSLTVRDCRHLTDASAIFQACVDHLRQATNAARFAPLSAYSRRHRRCNRVSGSGIPS